VSKKYLLYYSQVSEGIIHIQKVGMPKYICFACTESSTWL